MKRLINDFSIIAILLGVLGLSIDETSAAFLRLCNEVALGEKMSPTERSEKLVVATKALLQEFNIPEETRLRGELNRGEGCKVYVFQVA